MSIFTVTGVAGYVAPRHLKANRDTNHRLVATREPNRSPSIYYSQSDLPSVKPVVGADL